MNEEPTPEEAAEIPAEGPEDDDASVKQQVVMFTPVPRDKKFSDMSREEIREFVNQMFTAFTREDKK